MSVADWLVRLALGHDRPTRHALEVGETPRRIARLAAEVHAATGRCAAFLERHDGAGLFVISGDDREDLWAVVLAAAGGRPLFAVNVCAPAEDLPVEAVREAAGEAIALGGVLILDATRGVEGHEAALAKAAQALMEARCRAVLLISEDPERLPAVDAPMEVALVGTPGVTDQVAAWEAMLGTDGDARRSQVLGEVAARYPLGLAAIARAAAIATRRGGDASMEDLLDAARSQMAVRSIRLSHRVPLVFTWEDLVLPDEVLVALNEVVTYYRYREQVFDTWGFGRKLPYGRALSALFHGPSGTGKTMAASVLASEFRVPLFQVNLASIISKYVGETEKNLSLVFDDASRSRAMLLFDEADSLFARRTSGGSALDRYSNLEVNFLLQRMEAFNGLVVLTTNQESAIDSAFKRRIQYKTHFPAPDAAHRERLWRSMLRGAGDVSRDVNYAALAARFDIAGGIIKNAVIRAAFQAAEEGVPIAMRHLVRAAVRECKEAGQLVREEDPNG